MELEVVGNKLKKYTLYFNKVSSQKTSTGEEPLYLYTNYNKFVYVQMLKT